MYCFYVALGHNSSDYIHVLVEAVRLAVTDSLCYLGDPNHTTLPVDTLLDKSYSHQRVQHITMDRYVFLCVGLLVPVCTSHALLTLDSSVDFYPPRLTLTSVPLCLLPSPLLCLLQVCVQLASVCI